MATREGNDQWRSTRWLLAVTALAFAGLVVYASTGVPAEAAQGPKGPIDLTIALAPFLAIALAIERFWEAAFSLYENFALATARLVGVGAKFTDWARIEADKAAVAVKKAVEALGDDVPDPTLWTKFQEAEKRFLDAQARISESLKSPEYVSIKRAVTLLGSLAIGLLVATSMKLTLFATAGFGLSARVDAIVTGLLIGAGPGPLHSFVGVLQELRNSLAGLADLARGSGVKKAAESVGQAAAAAAQSKDAVRAFLPNAPVDALRHRRDAVRLLRPSA